MNDIICPHCKKTFKVDKQGYSDILKQVYDKEFDKKLNERLIQLNKDKSMEINLEKNEAEKKIQALENEKNKVIDELKFDIKEADNIKQLAVSQAVKDIEKERDKLKNELNNAELVRKNSENNLKDKYKGEIRHKDELIKLREDTILELKNMKAQLKKL